MRVRLDGVDRGEEAVEFSFETAAVTGYPGETVAAAMIAAGKWRFRSTRGGEDRGPFCGMGVCGDCLVEIDGVLKRACLEPVRDGADIRRAQPRARAPRGADSAAPDHRTLTPDLLIIGAGPAGLMAAKTAAEAGLQVLVVDERAKAGGQYFKQPGSGFGVDEARLDKQFREGRALFRETEAAGVTFLFDGTVWGIFGPGDVAVATPEASYRIAAKKLVLAPGAYERSAPFPGWTMPGVITTGAAQTLLRSAQVSPGRRVLVAGNGPLNIQLARELSRAGVDVVAVVEAAAAPGIGDVGQVAAMAAAAPGLMREGLGHVAALRLAGVPMIYRSAVIRAEGEGRVERAAIAPIGADGRQAGPETWHEVDALCLGYGFLPQSELARSLGCAHDYDPVRKALTVRREDNGATSVDGVYVVGDGGGLGGARVALSQGFLAGADAAAALDAPLDDKAVAAARRVLNRHRRFQAALWTLYAAPVITDQLAEDDTLICRCEEVSHRRLAESIEEGNSGPGAFKQATRAGMGRCQGRYCAGVIAEMRNRGAAPCDLDDRQHFAPRAPFKPVPIRQIAKSDDH